MGFATTVAVAASTAGDDDDHNRDDHEDDGANPVGDHHAFAVRGRLLGLFIEPPLPKRFPLFLT